MYFIRKSNKQLYRFYKIPIHDKFNGVYGYLVLMDNRIYFFWSSDDGLQYTDVTSEFDGPQIKSKAV